MHFNSRENGYQKPNTKQCAICGRDLHSTYPKELCPYCEEIELFRQVKDYIRENDVREQDVADKFDIPVRKVREWIHEGRIQYKEDKSDKIVSIKCKICGKPISFGNMCSECYSLQQLQVVANWSKTAEGKMHYFGQEKE